jgi:hypothetical protein
MTAIRAAPRTKLKRRRVRAEFMRIPWNAKQLACDSCGETEPVPRDLLLRFRLKTCLSCLAALAH